MKSGMGAHCHSKIGGYFGLELPDQGLHYHDTPYRMNSGRAAFHQILLTATPKKIYLSYYNCPVVMKVVRELKVEWEYYALDENLELASEPTLSPGEMIIYVDYYGMKGTYIDELTARYGGALIVDAAQSFFLRRNGEFWMFNSARKFFGVPDGSFLYIPSEANFTGYVAMQENTEYTADHLILREQGAIEEGYPAYRRNEDMQSTVRRRMSSLSDRLLSCIDYESVIKRRRSNYEYLDQRLGSMNKLQLTLSEAICPYCYPFLPVESCTHEQLIRSGIFVPSLWPDLDDTNVQQYRYEASLSARLLPLPIDHRYGPDEMQRISTVVLEIMGAKDTLCG